MYSGVSLFAEIAWNLYQGLLAEVAIGTRAYARPYDWTASYLIVDGHAQ